MVKRKHIWADEKYIELRNVLNKNLSADFGRPLSDREITKGVSEFLFEEDLLPHMLKRARRNARRKKKGWFL